MRFPEILQFAPIESSRFNLRAYRGMLENVDPEQLLSDILEKEIDLLILRIPAKNQYKLAALNELGIPFIMADTLVYYQADMQTIKPKSLRNKNLQFIQFTSEQFDIVDQMVEVIFADYNNNYSANPVLEADLVEIYKEWARSYATDHSKGKVSWLAGHENIYFGFITCLMENGGLEIVLNGVMPYKAGQGVYGDMIRFVQTYCIEKRINNITISTQVNNYAVQKVWAREGFHIKQAFLTIHMNSLMQKSHIAKKEFDFHISTEEFLQFSTGMTYSNCEKKSALDTGGSMDAFLLKKLVLAKYYREIIPVKKAAVQKISIRHIKQLQAEKRYRIVISYPYMNSSGGRYMSLLKLFDESGTVYLFAYFDFTIK